MLLPSSYPAFFRPPFKRRSSTPLYSHLSSTPSIVPLFKSHLDFVREFLRKGGDYSMLGPGIGREEVLELREGLVGLVEAFWEGGEQDGDEDREGEENMDDE